jgi:hypothetical protein
MIAKAACAALLVLAASAAEAQTYKCNDKAGAVTYSSEACEKQGLKDAGPVRDRLTTMPETSPTGKPAAKKKDAAAEKREAEKKER